MLPPRRFDCRNTLAHWFKCRWGERWASLLGPRSYGGVAEDGRPDQGAAHCLQDIPRRVAEAVRDRVRQVDALDGDASDKDLLTACIGKLHTLGLAPEDEKKLMLALAEKVATAPNAEPQTMSTTGRRSPQAWHDALQHNLPLHIWGALNANRCDEFFESLNELGLRLPCEHTY